MSAILTVHLQSDIMTLRSCLPQHFIGKLENDYHWKQIWNKCRRLLCS